MLSPLTLALTLVLAAAFDSRNISAAEWNCSGSLAVSFGGSVDVACGTEVLQNVTTGAGIAPTFQLNGAIPTSRYTVIVVDRDAPSQVDPSRSPIRHFATGDVLGASLAAGWSNGATAALWTNYSGPMPPNGTLCHRYYAMAYLQAANVTPSLPATTARFNWDFPTWASDPVNGPLVKVAVNVWRTQNLAVRTGACDATPPPTSGGPAQSAANVVFPIIVLTSVLQALAWLS